MAGNSNSSPTLAELAKRAATTYGQHVLAWVATAYLLHEARAIAPHGAWGAFLRSARIPKRTAERMLRIARTGMKCDTVTLLGGVRATLDFLAAADASQADWREALREYEDPSEMRSWALQNCPDGPNTALLWVREARHVNVILGAMGRFGMPLDPQTAAFLREAWGPDAFVSAQGNAN